MFEATFLKWFLFIEGNTIFLNIKLSQFSRNSWNTCIHRRQTFFLKNINRERCFQEISQVCNSKQRAFVKVKISLECCFSHPIASLTYWYLCASVNMYQQKAAFWLTDLGSEPMLFKVIFVANIYWYFKLRLNFVICPWVYFVGLIWKRSDF